MKLQSLSIMLFMLLGLAGIIYKTNSIVVIDQNPSSIGMRGVFYRSFDNLENGSLSLYPTAALSLSRPQLEKFNLADKNYIFKYAVTEGEVCWEEEQAYISSLGIILPISKPPIIVDKLLGCTHIKPNQLFLFGTHPCSMDSRYLGLVNRSVAIKGAYKLLMHGYKSNFDRSITCQESKRQHSLITKIL